ncbi:sulfotransferase family protein [Mesorhizobium sp. B2-4-19]|uniref:sulfotransferase family protein n=1 Tax=Mesorhizobium sp. B2-4-19 TaxID=2589930 RepID=UPI001FEE09EF|nr:sulfotransferase family protein [Mesorhizobium sp. B2-4-19]
MPSHAANPRGFFESAPLAIAHDELLALAGTSWLDWRQLDQQRMNSKATEPCRQKIKQLLIEEFGDEPLIVIKDPRTCRFVPFMSSILDEMNVSPVALLPVRNPLEVAYSLHRRDKITLPESLLLWLRHVLEAEYHSRHMPRYILSYEGFLGDWRKHMDRAAEKTGVVWPAQSDHADVKIEQFLTTDLYHERSTLEDVRNHPDVTSLVRETYQILTAIAAGDEDNGLLAQLDIMRTRFDEACETFSVAMATEELAVAQLRGELSARGTETEQVRQENSKLASFLEQQSVEIRGLADERDALVGTRDTLIAERDALVNTQASLIAERDVLVDAQASLIAERDALVDAQASLIAERDALVDAHASLIAERDALLRDMNCIANERDALLTSRSWRLTAPLRLIGGLFARG